MWRSMIRAPVASRTVTADVKAASSPAACQAHDFTLPEKIVKPLTRIRVRIMRVYVYVRSPLNILILIYYMVYDSLIRF